MARPVSLYRLHYGSTARNRIQGLGRKRLCAPLNRTDRRTGDRPFGHTQDPSRTYTSLLDQTRPSSNLRLKGDVVNGRLPRNPGVEPKRHLRPYSNSDVRQTSSRPLPLATPGPYDRTVHHSKGPYTQQWEETGRVWGSESWWTTQTRPRRGTRPSLPHTNDDLSGT